MPKTKEEKAAYMKQYNIDNRERAKQWEKDNAAKRAAGKKQWRVDNADKCKEHDTQYRVDNAEKRQAKLSTVGRIKLSQVLINGRDLYRVRVDPMECVRSADLILESLSRAGYPKSRIIVEK